MKSVLTQEDAGSFDSFREMTESLGAGVGADCGESTEAASLRGSAAGPGLRSPELPRPLALSRPCVCHLPSDDLYQPSWNRHFRIHGWEDNHRVCGDAGPQGYVSQVTVWTIGDGFRGNVNFCMKGTAALVPERVCRKKRSVTRDMRGDMAADGRGDMMAGETSL